MSFSKLFDGVLNEPRENSITYEDLEELEIVLLADEAHHYFAETKETRGNVTKSERDARSWERTIADLLKTNPKNRVLGFSATFDLNNEVLFHKIRDKIVYQYDLKKFMEDGYSKNVMLLRANEDDEIKMLTGVLLSQYRKYVARDHHVDLKPVILFKSNTIAVSTKANEKFVQMIDGLTIAELENRIDRGYSFYRKEQSILNKMYTYYKKMDLNEVIRDLQWGYSSGNIINANSSNFLTEDNALLLNTLENPNNPIRVIFAVAKLNEGWDVLNLFDIVRISEGASKTRNTTDSEAQLIGRGARYYPFIHEEKKSYLRRFDELPSDLKVIEALHYHTINDNTYIKNLESSLEAANIQVKEDRYDRLEAKVKKSLKKHPVFKEGKIYINKLVKTTADDYNSIEKYNVNMNYEIPLEKAIEQKYGAKIKEATTSYISGELEWNVERIYIQKAVQRNRFFTFENLRKYVPAISSMKTFIDSPKFLGNLKLYVKLPSNVTLDDILPLDKLKMVERFFDYLEKQITNNYMKERGTPIFEGVAFSKLVNDYYIELNKVVSKGVNTTGIIKEKSMREQDWFIYDKAIINNLEESLIDFISDYLDELEEAYEDVFLIRNERKIKIVEIDGVRGFMPDFLLYLKKEGVTYQVFLEPKGDHLRLHDQWKEEFLMSLSEREDVEVLSENEEVRLIGIKFYSEDPTYKGDFREDFKGKLM